MEALKQSLKIGAALAVVVVVGVAVLPERPTLFGGSGDIAVTAQDDMVLAGATLPETAGTSSAADDDAPVVVAQAETSATDDGLTAGQRHLERLRGGGGASTPAPSPAPAAPPVTPPPAVSPPAPAASPPPAAPAPSAGGGQGIDQLTQPSAPPEFRLFRSAEVLDTGTIRAGGETIRIAGVLPVAADARCADGSACGVEGQAAVRQWLSGQEVVCALSSMGGTLTAPCVRGESDIGEWVIANGWAQAEPGSVYVATETDARSAGLGIWAAGGL